MARLRRIILPSTITPEGMLVNSMESLGYDAAHQQAEYIFRTVLPACGMTVREGQIQLCHAMLDSLYNKEVTLCDAGVGLGKTYAYLIACLLWQWQRPREQWQPVVISTASVTLQDALLQQYIPFLSNALIQYGYIDEPAHAVLRKGKERFVCDARLEERRMQIAQRGEAFARRAALLRAADRYLDLDRVAGLSRYDRQHICVPNRCDRQCGAWESCRYRQYVRASNGPTITIQICNHNYLLADAVHRQGLEPIAAGLSGVDHRRSTLSARRRAANGDPPPVGAKTYATGGTTGPRTPSLRRTAGANPNTGVGGGLHIERARRRETPAGVRYHGRQRHGAGRDAESGDTDPGERTHAAAAPFAKPAGRNERTGRAVRPAR